MQMAMNIDTPDFGVLLNDMCFANGATIRAKDFTDPRIEVELAFVLKAPLAGEDVSIEQVMAATDYVVPALELIAARSYRVDPETGYTRNVFDTIADNAANAGYILSNQRFDPDAIEVETTGEGLLYGVLVSEGLLAEAEGPSFDRGLVVRRRWLDRAGTPVAARRFHIGDLVQVEVTLETPDEASVDNVAVVDVLSADTCAEPDLYFSYRRTTLGGGGDYGRLLSTIAIAP